MTLDTVPAAQTVGSVARVTPTKEPGGALTHAVPPDDGANEPAKQGVHVDAPAVFEYEPDEQNGHAAVAPGRLLNDPGAHVLQVEEPGRPE